MLITLIVRLDVHTTAFRGVMMTCYTIRIIEAVTSFKLWYRAFCNKQIIKGLKSYGSSTESVAQRNILDRDEEDTVNGGEEDIPHQASRIH